MADSYLGFAKDTYNLGKELLRREPKKDPRYIPSSRGDTYQKQAYAEQQRDSSDSQGAANYTQMMSDEMKSRNLLQRNKNGGR